MTPCIPLAPIDRHKYPEFVVSLLSNIYTITNCGFRKAIDLFKYLNETLGWNLQEIPCPNSVENWIKKSGYSIYSNPSLQTSENYGMIIDESIMLGSERMILNLGIKANKSTNKPLNYSDIEVLGIHVDSKWNSTQIARALRSDQKKTGKKPDYIISDNDSKLRKAILDYGCVQIRDIGHSIAMFLKRIYGKEADFVEFIKQTGRLKTEKVLSECSYLLPPRQRKIARFMNLRATVSWARKIIDSFSSFSDKEKEAYRFVVENENLISELELVFECTNQLLSGIKTAGLSYQSIGRALTIIDKELSSSGIERVNNLFSLLTGYFLEEAEKLTSSDTIWNASSDMIESVFGCYKFRRSKNSLHGVTAYVLILPLVTKMKEPEKGLDTNFKENLENVYMRDLYQWTSEYLTENQAIKRRNKLAA